MKKNLMMLGAVTLVMVAGLAGCNSKVAAPNACDTTQAKDGSIVLHCPGSEPVVVKNGALVQGCTVTDNQDGSYVLSCPGSDPVTIRDGKNGTNGTDGADAQPCTSTADP